MGGFSQESIVRAAAKKRIRHAVFVEFRVVNFPHPIKRLQFASLREGPPVSDGPTTHYLK
jgi:hypothetical protein